MAELLCWIALDCTGVLKWPLSVCCISKPNVFEVSIQLSEPMTQLLYNFQYRVWCMEYI